MGRHLPFAICLARQQQMDARFVALLAVLPFGGRWFVDKQQHNCYQRPTTPVGSAIGATQIDRHGDSKCNNCMTKELRDGWPDSAIGDPSGDG